MNLKYVLTSALILGQSAFCANNLTSTQEASLIEVKSPDVNIVKIIDFTGTREQIEAAFAPQSALLPEGAKPLSEINATSVELKKDIKPAQPSVAKKTTVAKEARPAKSVKQEEKIQSRTLNRAYSYTVRGKQYHAMKDAQGFEQYGKASWYGPGFHGKKTANGERYNMHDLTAAHKELPLGSKIEVTNTANGRKVVVRINDRGPFHGNRVLDLSKAAADKLGVLQQGVANVHIRVIQ